MSTASFADDLGRVPIALWRLLGLDELFQTLNDDAVERGSPKLTSLRPWIGPRTFGLIEYRDWKYFWSFQNYSEIFRKYFWNIFSTFKKTFVENWRKYFYNKQKRLWISFLQFFSSLPWMSCRPELVWYGRLADIEQGRLSLIQSPSIQPATWTFWLNFVAQFFENFFKVF